MKFYGKTLYGPPLLVPCPSCGAGAGHVCHDVGLHDPTLVVPPHKARKECYELWKQSLSHDGVVKR